FLEVLGDMVDEGQAARIHAALRPILASPAGRGEVKVTCAVLALALAPGALAAEDVPVTLAGALALAVQANPELQAAAARVEAQGGRAQAGRRGGPPRPRPA